MRIGYNWSDDIKKLIGKKIGLEYNADVNGFVDIDKKILYIFDGQYICHDYKITNPEKGWREVLQEWIEHGKYASIRTKMKQPWAQYEGYTMVSIEVYSNNDLDYYDVDCLCGDEVIKDGWLTSADDAWFSKPNEYIPGKFIHEYNYNHKKIIPRHLNFSFDLDELEKECGIV